MYLNNWEPFMDTDHYISVADATVLASKSGFTSDVIKDRFNLYLPTSGRSLLAGSTLVGDSGGVPVIARHGFNRIAGAALA
jgi:hypothetical protein